MTEKKILGSYILIRQVAKGGMGEVWLAYDPKCEREIALKKIKEELKLIPLMRARFLKEAKLTAQLTHPGIIPIFAIHEEQELYYTMPFIEGKSLKQLLFQHPLPTINSLIPLFISLLQTITFAHQQGILHRDLKPENILIQTCGEVLVLDWGLAQRIGEKEVTVDLKGQEEMTQPGRLVGTLAYMAPERIEGCYATVQTDIYALGVILYTALTGKLPFIRKNLKQTRDKLHREHYLPPEEIAPYREIPFRLSHIVKKALAPQEERYETVEAFLQDLKNYLAGNAEWYEIKKLNIHRKKDWELQEHVLLSQHLAITQNLDITNWGFVMISKLSFLDHLKLEAKIYIKEGNGIGFLWNVPEKTERIQPLAGYCLWLGTEESAFSQLFVNTREVMHFDAYLKKNVWHTVVIEKRERHVHFFLDHVLQGSYLTYLPALGSRVGIVTKDFDFEMSDLILSSGNQNLSVSCLAIPDAFLASRYYKKAFMEYRRMSISFQGYSQGREATFKAGLTLLEEAKTCKNTDRSKKLFRKALEEFSRLHTTAAPLEYLGKSLVYQALEDESEELKCLELALRRYHQHPLFHVITEQVLYRMHEHTQHNRKKAYRWIALAVSQLGSFLNTQDNIKLFKKTALHWEDIWFFETTISLDILSSTTAFLLRLSFWLASPHRLVELLQTSSHVHESADVLFALYELGCSDAAATLASTWQHLHCHPQMQWIVALAHIKQDIAVAAACFDTDHDSSFIFFRSAYYTMQHAVIQQRYDLFEPLFQRLYHTYQNYQLRLDTIGIIAYLQHNKWNQAATLFKNYSLEQLSDPQHPLYSLWGCYLRATQGIKAAMQHFAYVVQTAYPASHQLLAHQLNYQLLDQQTWFHNSFLWERRMLYQQLALYHHCSQEEELSKLYQAQALQEYVHFAL